MFGQGCLLARRLVEAGVTFVEVALGGWDTHQDNFDAVPKLSRELDAAWAVLMQDLQERNRLDRTLVVVDGRVRPHAASTSTPAATISRTPLPRSWPAAASGEAEELSAGPGAGGDAVEDRPVSVPELLATLCHTLGIDATKQNVSNTGRPISIVEKSAEPIAELLR